MTDPLFDPERRFCEQLELFSESVRPPITETPDAVAQAVREAVERMKNGGDDQLGPGSGA